MNINKKNIKQFKNYTKKVVLAGTLATVMLTSPAFMTNAKAVEPIINPNGYYDISSNGYYMQVNGNIDYSIITDMNKINEIYISNATIDKSFSFSNSKIDHIVFKNCNFTSPDFKDYKNITAYSFIGCKFDNLDFLSKCSNITNLDFDSCEIGNVDALKNLNNLQSVNFYDVGIENINFLKDKRNLVQLILVNTCVSDLSPIKNSNIGFLDISNTSSIQDLSPVLSLDNLYAFYSQNCEMAYTDELYNFVKRNRIESNIKKDDLKIKDEVKKIADKIITNNMTEKEKIFSIINYVVDNIEYDYEVETNQDLSIKYNEHALKYALQGFGCCKNYTALTTALLQSAGIDVYEIKGNNHIWNLIEVEGQYYWIDSTWLDGLEDIEILDSCYYMNNSPLFPGHDQLTLPTSMYDDVYLVKNNVSEEVITPTTPDNNNNDNTINYVDDNEDLTMETTTYVESQTEDETTPKTEIQSQVQNENVDNNKIEQTTNSATLSSNDTKYILENLKSKKVPIGVIVGFALTFGCAFMIKTKKKNMSKDKTK